MRECCLLARAACERLASGTARLYPHASALVQTFGIPVFFGFLAMGGSPLAKYPKKTGIPKVR